MLILFVLLSIVLGIAIVSAIAFPYLYRIVYRKKYHEIFGRKLYRLAMNRDYYLINRLVLKSRDASRFVIDHLMFGNKFIYAFYDFYCEESLSGKSTDNSFLIRGKKSNSYTDNPALIAKQRIKELSILIGLDESLFVPIALVNNTCDFIDYDDNNSIVYLRKLTKVIDEYEKKNVNPLNQEQMMYAVHDISCINLRDKKE